MTKHVSSHQREALLTVQSVAFYKDLKIFFPWRPAFNFFKQWLKLQNIQFLISCTERKGSAKKKAAYPLKLTIVFSLSVINLQIQRFTSNKKERLTSLAAALKRTYITDASTPSDTEALPPPLPRIASWTWYKAIYQITLPYNYNYL